MLGGITYWAIQCIANIVGRNLVSHMAMPQRHYFATARGVSLDSLCERGKEQSERHWDFRIAEETEPAARQIHLSQLLDNSSEATQWTLYLSATLYLLSTIDGDIDRVFRHVDELSKYSKGQESGSGRGTNNHSSSLTNAFLRWFDAYAVFAMSNQLLPARKVGILENASRDLVEGVIRRELRTQWATDITRRRRTAQMNSDIYSTTDELHDRMALLVGELTRLNPLEKSPAVLSFVKNLHADVENSLRERSQTRQIRAPSPVERPVYSEFVSIRIRDELAMYEDGLQWSPWELTCANFLIYMQCTIVYKGTKKIKRREQATEIVDEAFSLCRPFLQRSFSVVPTWDNREALENIASWWSTEADALLAANLIADFTSAWSDIFPRLPGENTLTSEDSILEESSDIEDAPLQDEKAAAGAPETEPEVEVVDASPDHSDGELAMDLDAQHITFNVKAPTGNSTDQATYKELEQALKDPNDDLKADTLKKPSGASTPRSLLAPGDESGEQKRTKRHRSRTSTPERTIELSSPFRLPPSALKAPPLVDRRSRSRRTRPTDPLPSYSESPRRLQYNRESSREKGSFTGVGRALDDSHRRERTEPLNRSPRPPLQRESSRRRPVDEPSQRPPAPLRRTQTMREETERYDVQFLRGLPSLAHRRPDFEVGAEAMNRNIYHPDYMITSIEGNDAA